MKKTIYGWLTLGILFTGCSDFLEPNSPSEFVPKDIMSLNEMLLGEAYQRNDKSGLNTYLNLMEDDIAASEYQEPTEGYDANKYLSVFTWQPDMYKMMKKAGFERSNIYAEYYKLINGANAAILYLPKVKYSDINMMYSVKGQAHALRAFYYFNLVNIYGMPYNVAPDSLGVPLKLVSGIEDVENDNVLSRKTVRQVYEQILKDLHIAEEAYQSMPQKLQWQDNFRTSLPMVQLMLSRTYLYMQNWEMAAAYADSVIKNPQFHLLDLNTVPDTKVNDKEEAVRNFVIYPTYECPETIWPYGSIEDMFKWTYERANKENNDGGISYAYFRASDSLMNCFETDDIRKKQYVVEAPKGANTEGTVEMMFMPYGKVYVSDTYFFPVNYSGVFGRCLRLSEAYLNLAEALAMQNDPAKAQQAVKILNDLRINRFTEGKYVPLTYTSHEDLVNLVRLERRRELCFEGHRWYDLRRWGMPSFTHTWYDDAQTTTVYTLTASDLLYTVPLPDEALEMNTRLKQNTLPGKRQPQIDK